MKSKMHRKEYLVIFTCLLVSVVNAFGGGAPMPPNEPPEGDVQGDEHIYPCFTAINCVLGTPDHDKFKDCLSVLDETDREVGISWFIEEGDDTKYEDVYHVLNVTFCGLDKDPRKKKFDSVIEKLFELYSVGCETRYEKKTCEHWEEMTECLANLMDELNSEDKCDISEFDKD